MSSEKIIRVLLTKPWMDGHDRGMRYVAQVLREAGMEVITTRFELPEEAVKTAIQEDVDVIAISSYMGGHKRFCADITSGLKEKDIKNILLIAGGIIPEDDVPELLEVGIGRVFPPGSQSIEIINYIHSQKGQSD